MTDDAPVVLRDKKDIETTEIILKEKVIEEYFVRRHSPTHIADSLNIPLKSVFSFINKAISEAAKLNSPKKRQEFLTRYFETNKKITETAWGIVDNADRDLDRNMAMRLIKDVNEREMEFFTNMGISINTVTEVAADPVKRIITSLVEEANKIKEREKILDPIKAVEVTSGSDSS